MLRASHRVLKPGGTICFVVIALADGLSRNMIAAAIEAGPPEVEAGPGYPRLMTTAGFAAVDMVDVTEDYLMTLRAWVREWDAESTALRRLVGADDFAERQANRRRAIKAVKEGLLRRYLITSAKDPVVQASAD